MGLFSKKDKIDKYWDKFNTVFSHPKTTAKNAFLRLHNTTWLPGGMPLEFEPEEQEEFAKRYGAQFCDLMTSALTQGKVSLDFADVLFRDYMNSEEMEEDLLEKEDSRAAYMNYIHVGIERYLASDAREAKMGDYFMAQNKVLYEFMMDDAGELSKNEVERYILKLQDLAYQAKGKEDTYSHELFSYVENLMSDREDIGLSDNCLYELLNQAFSLRDIYGNALLLKTLDVVAHREQSDSSEDILKQRVVNRLHHEVWNSKTSNTDKAWLSYVLKVYCDVECEDIDVISGRYNLIDRSFASGSEEGKLSAVCVHFNVGARKPDDDEMTYIFYTKNTAPTCEVLQYLQDMKDIQSERQDEKMLLTNCFNQSAEFGVYAFADYKESIPETFGESGAVLVERIKNEQHLKKLQKLTIH